MTRDALADLWEPGAGVRGRRTEAVGQAAEAQLLADGHDVRRRAGADRYGTAVALVEEVIAQGADPDPTVIATGVAFATRWSPPRRRTSSAA